METNPPEKPVRNGPPPTLHLMVGLPCSGKTTYARRLHAQGPGAGIVLTPDVWQLALYGDDFSPAAPPAERAAHDRRHSEIEALMWEVAARLLRLGVSVILDYGFWAREEREDFRARGAALGARVQVHYMEAPLEELKQRARRRNAENDGDVFPISDRNLEEWAAQFEPPTAEELEPYD